MTSTSSMNGQLKDLFTCAIQSNVAIPVAAMHSLIYIIKTSKATTWMGLEQDLREAIHSLKSCKSEELNGYTKISLGSGCDIFMKFVSRAFSMEIKDFQECKNEILRRGEKFANLSMSARLSIAKIGHSFVEDGFTVFVHGNSRCVSTLLMRAAEDDKQFSVIISEGRPRADG